MSQPKRSEFSSWAGPGSLINPIEELYERANRYFDEMNNMYVIFKWKYKIYIYIYIYY